MASSTHFRDKNQRIQAINDHIILYNQLNKWIGDYKDFQRGNLTAEAWSRGGEEKTTGFKSSGLWEKTPKHTLSAEFQGTTTHLANTLNYSAKKNLAAPSDEALFQFSQAVDKKRNEEYQWFCQTLAPHEYKKMGITTPQEIDATRTPSPCVVM